MGGSMLLWAVLAGAVVLALLCGVLGWMLLNVLRRMTLKSLPLRPWRLAACYVSRGQR